MNNTIKSSALIFILFLAIALKPIDPPKNQKKIDQRVKDLLAK